MEKIDFLFVIDNSASMREEQRALAASVPGFIDTLKEKIMASTDVQIALVHSGVEVKHGHATVGHARPV